MEKSMFTIGRKIFGGFISLIIIFAVNAVTSIFTIDSNKKTIIETTEVISPSSKAISDLNMMLTESKMLVTNWVYLQNNLEDKEALKDLQDIRYPELKSKIHELAQAWENESQKQYMDSIFTGFEEIIDIEKEIMGSLVRFEDYEDPMVKMMAEENIESEILPRTNQLKAKINSINTIKKQEEENAWAGIMVSEDKLKYTVIVLGVIIVILGLIGAAFLTSNITRPINRIRNIIVNLSKGELPKEDQQKEKFNRDEVGEMAHAVNELVKGLRATSNFAEKIGEGNYQSEFTPLSEHDVLGNSLIEMKENLQRVAEEDRKRNWATEGSAKFGEILRQHNHSVSDLANNILSHLVKYMHANQGGLYIVQDYFTEEEPYMVLEACYAWDKKKYIEQKIFKGEGLAGQAWLEKDTIYITDVPEEYISITSGLGDANPTSILIVPLLVNEEVYGAIELASFKEFNPFEIEFLEKIAESIASSISSAKINTKTQRLLEESQQQAEEMRAQEEEVRQNMEELSATQEEMQRVLKQSQQQEAFMNDILNATQDSICTIDRQYKLINFNKTFKESIASMGMNLEKGFDIKSIYTAEQWAVTKMHYDRALAGERFSVTQNYSTGNQEVHYLLNYSPLRNAAGDVIGIAMFAKDITEVSVAKQKAEEMLAETQQKTEEMLAQEEELRQNMEELSATQEEMQRILGETQSKEAFMNDLINSTTDSIITVDRDYRLIVCNQATKDTYTKSGLILEKGFDIMTLFTDEQRPVYKAYYDRALGGEYFEITESYKFEGREQFFAIIFSPLRNAQGDITGIASFGKDITETIVSKKNIEAMLEASQEQAEEMVAQEEVLKQNMEELAATQEEMNRIIAEVQNSEYYMNELINLSEDAIYSVDRDYEVVNFNSKMAALFESMGKKLEKRADVLKMLDKKDKQEQKTYFDRAFLGEQFDVSKTYQHEGGSTSILLTYYPIRNANKEVSAVAVFVRNMAPQQAVSAR